VVSGLLLKARFVFDEHIDYIGFGLLLFAGVTSIGMVLFMKVFHFIKRKWKECKEPPKQGPSYGHKGCGIPYYIRLTKWHNMEIYMIAISIGIWQLGSVISYAIYLYCDILTKIFDFMSYVGIVEQASAQCYNTQARLPENLLILIGSFTVMMILFVKQARGQYKKNISDSLRWIDDDDVPRLSLAWSQDKSKNSKYVHLSSSLTASMSWETNSSDATPSRRSTPPGTPATETWTPSTTDGDGDDNQWSTPASTSGPYRNINLDSLALHHWSANDNGNPEVPSQSTPDRIGSVARRLHLSN